MWGHVPSLFMLNKYGPCDPVFSAGRNNDPENADLCGHISSGIYDCKVQAVLGCVAIERRGPLAEICSTVGQTIGIAEYWNLNQLLEHEEAEEWVEEDSE